MKQLSPFRQFLRTSGLGRWGLAVTVLLILLAVLAPWIAPANPSAQSLPDRLLSPSAHHWMGTDELGRDVLSRALYGARVSLLVGVSVVVGAGIVGLALGSLSGYFGGAFDRFINIVLINSFLSFPGNSAGHRVCGVSGAGIGQGHPGADHHGMGRIRAPGARPGDESARNGIHPGRAFAGRFARAHPAAAPCCRTRCNPS